METSRRPFRAVMLVDLDLLVAILCSLPRIFTRNEFDALLTSKKKNKKKTTYGESTLDSYFYSAIKWGLITLDDGIYVVTVFAREICDLRSKGSESEFKAYLANLLEVKEPAFRSFLDYLKEPRGKQEIYRAPNAYTGKTLIAWGEKLGVISFAPTLKKYYAINKTHQTTKDEFWSALVRGFEGLRRTGLIASKINYVKIPDLRDICSICLHLKVREPPEESEFDILLRELLSDDKFAHRIELSGAPIVYITYEKGIPFIYKDREYYFIGLS